jgi:hypothetical protein
MNAEPAGGVGVRLGFAEVKAANGAAASGRVICRSRERGLPS